MLQGKYVVALNWRWDFSHIQKAYNEKYDHILKQHWELNN